MKNYYLLHGNSRNFRVISTLLTLIVLFLVTLSVQGQGSMSTTPPLSGSTVSICQAGNVVVNVTGADVGQTYKLRNVTTSTVLQTIVATTSDFSFTALTFSTTGTRTMRVFDIDLNMDITFYITVVANPVAPTITFSPNAAYVVAGTNVTAALASAGTGGVDSYDHYEVRKRTGSATWSTWSAYTLGDNITTASISGFELRAKRTPGTSGLGCDEVYNTYSMDVHAFQNLTQSTSYLTLHAAMAAANTGDIIEVAAGTYPIESQVNIDKAVTIRGSGSNGTWNSILTVTGTGERFFMTAAATLENLDITKTDHAGVQNIVYIGASNIKFQYNKLHGLFTIGDGDVVRGIVFTGGLSGLLLDHNEFYNLRQPGYMSGPTTGMISNNYTYNTKGWVMEGGDMSFSGNTWGTNVYDIVILSMAPSSAYTDIVAISAANNDAVIEDQRVSPAVLSVVHVDASTSYSSDLGGVYHPYSSITPAVTRVVANGTIKVKNGTYNEFVTFTKALNLIGESRDGVIINAPCTGGNALSLFSNSSAKNLTVTRNVPDLTAWYACGTNQGVVFPNGGTNVTIDNIKVYANRNGVYINNCQNATVKNCLIDNNRTGLQCVNNISGMLVTNNFITNNYTHGVLLNVFNATNLIATNAKVENNDITGNWYSEIALLQTGTGTIGDVTGMSFTCNWYGTAPRVNATNTTEPGYSTQVPGLFGGTAPGLDGDIRGNQAGLIVFRPYLIDGSFTAPGFTPTGTCLTPTAFYVNDNSTTGDVYTSAIGNDSGFGTAAAPFRTLQYAMKICGGGETIYMDAGTYAEIGQIVIDKNLNVVGADKSLTLLHPDNHYGSDGWIKVNSGIGFNLSKVTVDGSNYNIYNALLHQGSGTIQDCNFTEIKSPWSSPPSGTIYQGTAIKIVSTQNVNVSDCYFTQIGRNGIRAQECTGTYSGNNYTGKGAGDWMDYFILSEYGDNVVISGNTISNCTGVALSDGSNSAAMAVWDDPGTQATISGNTMTNNTIGVGIVAYSGGTTDPKVVFGAGNLFDGGEYGVEFGTWGPAFNPDVTFTGLSTFKGQTKQSIYLSDSSSMGDIIDISSVEFKTAGGTLITDPFAIEDLVSHKIDAPYRGLFMWNASDVYVTTNSFDAPSTTVPSIQRAINAASPSWTVNVGTGTFNENVLLNKAVTLKGLGAASTILTPATACTYSPATGGIGIAVSAAGAKVKDLKVTAFFTGISVASQNNEIDNVEMVSNCNQAIELSNGCGNITVTNSKLNNNFMGFRKGTVPVISGFTMENCEVKGNSAQGCFIANASGGNFTNVSIKNSDFSNNLQKGMYFEALNNAVLDGIIMNNSGTDATYGFNTGIDINLKYGNYSNITLQNSEITNCGATGIATALDNPVAVAIKARDDGGYAGNPATLTNVIVQNNIISGPNNGIRFGEFGKINAGPTGVTVYQNDLSAAFSYKALINNTNSNINAECNWWGSPAGGTIAARIKDSGTGITDYNPWITTGGDGIGTGFQPTGSCSGTILTISSATPTHIHCGETNTGTINVIWADGTANYTVAWTPGSGSPATGIAGTTYTITGLAAGIYNITVTDINGTYATTTAEVKYLPVTRTTLPSTVNYHATIQEAITAASPNDVIDVCAGVYREDITIDKSLSLRGANYGINPNTGSRGAESIIQPFTSDPDYATFVYLSGNISGVTIDGFTLDGDNDLITSGVDMNGADINAGEAIGGYDGVANSSITNNIIKNLGYAGIDLYNYYNAGAATTGNTVSNNWFDNIIPATYGIGVLIYNNCYTNITDNVMTRVRIGVQTGNFYQADPGNSHSISNNDIESKRLGIFHNLQYSNAASFTISDNNFETYPGSTNNNGIVMSSIQGTVGATLSGNNVNGAMNGINLWNCPTSNYITVTGGTLLDCSVGVFANNYDGYSSNANSSHYVVDGVTITNPTYAGVYVKDNTLNTNGSVVSATIQGNTTISGTAAGMSAFVVEGKDASLDFAGSGPQASVTGTPKYFVLQSNGTDVPAGSIDATQVSLDGNYGSAMSASTLFSTEDKIDHKIDLYTLGLVTFKANNDYVTVNSYLAPETTPLIQRAIDAASAGWTVNVGPGNFDNSMDIAKGLFVQGQGAGVTNLDRSVNTAAGDVVYIHDLSENVTVDGFTFKTGPASSVASNGINVRAITGSPTITISNNEIWGYQSATMTNEINFGLIAGYLTVSTPKLVFTDNTVNGGSDNPILIEKWLGPVEITNNFLYQNPLKDFSSSDVIFMMNYGGTTNSSLQYIHGNTIDMGWGTVYNSSTRGVGISIAASYTGGTSAGGFTNVEISDNTLLNLKTSRRGISLWNNSSNGTGGDIANAIISGNTISNAAGYSGEFGIRMLGKSTGTQVSNNLIDGVNDAVIVAPYNGHESTGTVIHNNSLLATTGFGLKNTTSGTVDATCNWWGVIGSAGIAAEISGSGVDYTPWLISGLDGGDPGFQPAVACDQTPPTFSPGASPLTVECDGAGNLTEFQNWLDTYGGAIATDESLPITWTNDYNVGNWVADCGGTKHVLVIFTATDYAGNSSSTGPVQFTIQDVTAPALTGTPYGGTTGTNACMADAATAAPWNATNAIEGYSDICSGPVSATLTNTAITGTNCDWTVTYTYYVEDACGNKLLNQSYFNKGSDQTAPSLTGAPFAGTTGTNACMADAAAAAPWSMASAIMGYTDNCGTAVTATLTNTDITGTNCDWTVTYTYYVEDACGNKLMNQYYFNKGSNQTAPTITGTLAVYAVEGCNISALPAPTNTIEYLRGLGLTIADACSPENLTVTSTDGVPSGTCPITVIRTYKVTDACGNFATVDQTITIKDNTAPVITGTPPVYAVEGCTIADLPPANNTVAYLQSIGLTITDACEAEGLTVTNTVGAPSGSCPITVVRTYRVTDACGNYATVDQTITIDDLTAPVITPPATLQVECNDPNANASINAWLATASATDNCDPSVSVTNNFVAPSPAPGSDFLLSVQNIKQTTDRIMEFDIDLLDANPSSSFILASIQAGITLNPAIYAGGTLSCTIVAGSSQLVAAQVPATVTYSAANAIIRLAARVPVGPAGSTVIGTSSPGTRVIRLKLTSTVPFASGVTPNFAFTSNTVAAPLYPTRVAQYIGTANTQLTVTPGSNAIALENPPLNGSTALAVMPSTRNVTSYAGSTTFNVISATTWTVTSDQAWCSVTPSGSGRGVISATCTENTSVTPRTAHITVSEPSGTPVIVTVFQASPSVTITMSCNSETTVTFNAADACGNVATPATSIIRIIDTTAPVITPPANLEVVCNDPNAATIIAAWLATASATDNCDASVTVTNNYTGITMSCNNLVTVTFNAVDACGNNAIPKTATIRIIDTTAPVITPPANLEVVCNDPNAVILIENWLATASATDNCDASVTVTNDYTGIAMSCNNLVTVTFNAVDACGNNAIPKTATIRIIDTTAPVITPPANLEVACNDPNAATIIAAWLATASATDNCDASVTVTNNYTGITMSCNNLVTVTFNAVDACGNNAIPKTATIRIIDTTAPVITPPANLEVVCNDPNAATIIAAWLATASATDNCDASVTVTNNYTGIAMSCNNLVTVTFNAVDACGNNATAQTATIRIIDTTAPVITPPATLQVECNDPNAATIIAAWLATAAATDNCDAAVTVTNDYAGITMSCNNLVTVTFNAVDACGNNAIPKTATIRIIDTTAPVITPPATLQVECNDPNAATIIAAWLTTASATDNCDASVTVTNNYTGIAMSCNNLVTVTFNAVDACGNNAIPKTATIRIIDTTAPVITPPANLEVVCNDPNAATIIAAWLATASATDNCDATVTVTNDYTGIAMSCNNLVTVTFNAVDACGNNAIPKTATIRIIDTTAPVITPPANLEVECNDPNAATIIAAWLATASATDNCDATVTVTNDYTGITMSCNNLVTVTFNAVDACGNNATAQTATIRIIDTTAPVLTGAPYSGTTGTDACMLNAADAAPWVMSNAIIGYTDNCNQPLTATLTNTVVTGTDCDWTVTYTYYVEDACGNKLFNQFYFNKGSDQTAPALNGTPFAGTTGTNACMINAATAAPWSAASAIIGYTDNCGAAVTATLTNTAVTGSDLLWTVTYTYYVEDACGNKLFNRTYSNTGSDQTAPTIACIANQVRCATTTPTTYTAIGTEFDPASTGDNCNVANVSYALSGATGGTGSTTLSGVAFNAGTTLVTWTVTDGGNNTAFCSFNVVINPLPTPSISGSSPVCANSSGNVYSTASVSGHAYLWTVTGATSFTGQGTPSVNVTWGNGATGTVSVTEFVQSTFCSASDSKTVTLSALPTPTVTGPATVVTGTSASYSTSNIFGYAYTWNVTGAVSFTGQGTPTINVLWGPAGTGTVTVTTLNILTGCVGSSPTLTVAITLGGYKVSGYFRYHNNAGTALDNLSLVLKSGASIVKTATTGSNGYYEFTAVQPGSYTVEATTGKPEGGINTTDASATNTWWVAPTSIERVKFYAGDANNSGTIQSTDASAIQGHYVYGTAFARGIWTFAAQPLTSNANPPSGSGNSVTVASSDITQNFYGLCVGDFNRSYTPPTGKNAASGHSGIGLVYSGTQHIAPETEFDLPIYVNNSMQIGAISMTLIYPEDLASVVAVYLSNGNGSEPVPFSVNGNQLRIGWTSPNTLELPSNAQMITIRMKTTQAFISGQSIKVAMTDDYLNELADGFAVPFVDAVLSTNVIEAAPTGINNLGSASISLSNHPNPFDEYTYITYSLPTSGKVVLELHNILGAKVSTLVNTIQAEGKYTLRFDGSDLNPGVYTATLKFTSGSTVEYKTIKLVHDR